MEMMGYERKVRATKVYRGKRRVYHSARPGKRRVGLKSKLVARKQQNMVFLLPG